MAEHTTAAAQAIAEQMFGGCRTSTYGKACAGPAYLGNALCNLHTYNDGVLLVEDAVGQYLEDAWEDGVKLGGLLLFLLHLNQAEHIARW